MSTSVRPNTASAYAAMNKKAPLTQLDRRKWLPRIVLTCVATLNLVGLLLIVRRFRGALQEPLPTGHMLFTALVITTLAAYCRTAWRQASLDLDNQGKRACPGHNRWSRFDRWVGWGSSLGLVLLAVGCTYPAERLSDWLVWMPLLVADQFWRQSFFDGGKPAAGLGSAANGSRKTAGERRKAAASTTPSGGAVSIRPAPNPPVASRTEQPMQSGKLEARDIVAITAESPGSRASEHDQQLLQQIFRIRNAAGQETIYGTLRADFERGQRNASLYLGFCPPLAHPPRVEAEPVDGPAATLKVVQALAHGARVDLRLDRPASAECHVLVDLAALGAD